MKKHIALVCVLCLCLTAVSALAAGTTYTGIISPIVINTPGEHTITLNNVTIEASDCPAISMEAPASKLTIVLKDGSRNTLIGARKYAGIANNGVNLVIRCEHAGTGHKCNSRCGQLYVEGGMEGAGIGGSFRYPGDPPCHLEGSIRIGGGNIQVLGGAWAAGIGGSSSGDLLGVLTISGGNVKVNGGQAGAGIGGGHDGSMDGIIRITGGNVRVNGGQAGAGIGGGFGADLSGLVEITDGNVSVEGIGGGYEGNMDGTVRITGGYVKTNGNQSGAGIGGGLRGSLTGSVEITGGVVEAIGDYEVAGIGGGSEGSLKGTVLISGGKVTAIGGRNAAGIGGGGSTERSGGTLSGTITVTGGEVEVIGGENAPAIGAGANGKLAEEAAIVVNPATYNIMVVTGDSKQTAVEIEGSPFTKNTNITALLKNMQYAKFTTPAVPQTGDSTHPAQLALLAMLGLTGIILLRRKRAI
ncbi:MAG: LPXTG cell wall anchor domain-containing protein [Clostridia bacterium]|nr:LPXTG cell wall anchor domain-containing protein [Clostridia bacterium]